MTPIRMTVAAIGRGRCLTRQQRLHLRDHDTQEVAEAPTEAHRQELPVATSVKNGRLL